MYITRVLKHTKMLTVFLTTVVLIAFACKRWYPLMFDHAVGAAQHVAEVTVSKLYNMHWGIWVAILAAIFGARLRKMLKKPNATKKRVPKRSAHSSLFDTYCRRRKQK